MHDKVRLGADGPEVLPFALGGAAMSGRAISAEADAVSAATIGEALDRGVTLIDTADFYGAGHNEMLIGGAIRNRRDDVVLSVKFGGMRAPDGAFVGIDGRPAAVKNYLGYTLRRLGVDHVDIYRPARLDPQVPIEDTVGAIAELVQAGWVRHIGLSEMGADTIRRAHAVHPICDVQLEYSLMSRGAEASILPVLRELGIGMTAYGVLAHGLLSGTVTAQTAADPSRAHLPWFHSGNFERNAKLVDALAQVAADKGVTPGQLATAWVLARGAATGTAIVPVIGARRPEQLRESLGALDLALSPQDVARIEAAVPADQVAGTRYDERLMRMLDSER